MNSRGALAVLTTVGMNLLAARLQAQGYQPSYANPHGTELVAVYISFTHCVGNTASGLHEALDSLKVILAARARAAGREFRMVGVALDWEPDSGLAYLRGFGAFDELDVGRNWYNLGAERWIWSDSSATTNVPQVVVYEQTITPAGRHVTFSTPHVVKRVFGGTKIVEWVRAGAATP
jgi:hypothetical protein